MTTTVFSVTTLFPWFTYAKAKQVFNLQEIAAAHFYWLGIGVDLNLERIEHPKRFSIVADNRRKNSPRVVHALEPTTGAEYR